MNDADMPLVTVIISSFNYDRFVGECIESALNQTWQRMQIVVIDDGSTDNSRQVVARFGDSIEAIFKENGGQASAFNVGIAAARGSIICFMDSDDKWKPNKVEEVVKKFESGPWALVSNGIEDIDEQGKLLPQAKYDHREGDFLADVKSQGLPWYVAITSGLSVRSDVARSLYPLPEHAWRHSADGLIVFGGQCYGPVGVIEATLTQYRRHASNVSSFSHDWSGQAKKAFMNFIMSVRNFLFLNDRLIMLGRAPATDLKDTYRFYRVYSFVAMEKPWLNLTKLWRLNFLFSHRTQVFVVAPFHFLRYMLIDAALCIVIPLGLSKKYVELRRLYRKTLDQLDVRDDYDRRTLEYIGPRSSIY